MQTSPLEYNLTAIDQLCFVHIPKTAGTTLTAILESQFDRAEICPANFWVEINQMPREEFDRYRLFRGHFPYTIRKFLSPDAAYVTVFRDPIKRVVSAYEFMKTCVPVRPESVLTQQKARSLTLRDFVLDPDVPGMVNAQTRHIAGRELRREYPDLTQPEWLEAAKENLEKFIVIGLTERFDDSLALLHYAFGWQPPAQVQNLMVGKKKAKTELPADVLDAIVERNQLDVELYQYAKQLFAHRYDQMVQELNTRYGAGSISEQLQHHYQARYAQADRPRQSSLSFTFNQAMAGSGWHGWEGEGRHTAFRWTGPGLVSTLDFLLVTDRDLMIEFRVLNAVTPEILDSLILQVNGHLIPCMTLHRDDYTTIVRGTIPQSVLVSDLPFTRLTFRVSHTASLHDVDPNHPDTRPLGVAIDLIQIFPVGTTPAVVTTAFLFDSPAWQDAVDFLKNHLQPGQQILAPNVFRLQFSSFMPSEDTIPIGKICNYASTTLDRTRYQWLVLHKGMKTEIGSLLQQLPTSGFQPVFANEVFTLFTNQAQTAHLPILNYFSRHVRSAYTGYFKYALAHSTEPGYKLYRQLRFRIKKLVKPNALPDS